MKNIFTKQFRHFFLILFAVLLILQLLGSELLLLPKQSSCYSPYLLRAALHQYSPIPEFILQLFISSAAAFITAIL